MCSASLFGSSAVASVGFGDLAHSGANPTAFGGGSQNKNNQGLLIVCHMFIVSVDCVRVKVFLGKRPYVTLYVMTGVVVVVSTK